jgi:hypothetical protein
LTLSQGKINRALSYFGNIIPGARSTFKMAIDVKEDHLRRSKTVILEKTFDALSG